MSGRGRQQRATKRPQRLTEPSPPPARKRLRPQPPDHSRRPETSWLLPSPAPSWPVQPVPTAEQIAAFLRAQSQPPTSTTTSNTSGPTLAYLVVLMVFGLVGNTLVILVYYNRFKPTSTRTYILVPEQEFHSFAREEQTIGTLQQPKDSASTFTSKRSRYKEDGTASTGKLHSVNTMVRNRAEDREDCKASAGKLQINITKNVKLDKIITAMDQPTISYTPPSSEVMSSRLARGPKTETSSFQQEPDRFNSSTNVSIITVLKGAEIEGDASKYHEGSTTDSRQKVHEAKKESRKIGTIKVPTRTTLMMFVLTAMFVMSHVPYLIIAVLFRGKTIMIVNFWEWNAYQIALRSYFFSTAINSLVYSFCSRMFWKECYLFVCRK
ncbi:hypothetical protein ACOMHN_030758 [Nucella lapillus]